MDFLTKRMRAQYTYNSRIECESVIHSIKAHDKDPAHSYVAERHGRWIIAIYANGQLVSYV